MARPIATICRYRAYELLGTLTQFRKQAENALQVVRLALARTGGMGAENEVLVHGEIGEDAAILGHERDAGLNDFVRRAVGDVGAVHEHARAVHLARLPSDRPQEGALAGAVGADESDDSGFDVDGQIVEGVDAGVMLGELARADEGHDSRGGGCDKMQESTGGGETLLRIRDAGYWVPANCSTHGRVTSDPITTS